MPTTMQDLKTNTFNVCVHATYNILVTEYLRSMCEKKIFAGDVKTELSLIAVSVESSPYTCSCSQQYVVRNSIGARSLLSCHMELFVGPVDLG